MLTPAYCRHEAYEIFRAQIPSIETSSGLFRAAFSIALHERPEAEFAETETIVENLTDTVRRRVQSRATSAVLAHLHDVLFDVFGLRGNVEDYYRPANSYLPDVLRTRLGIPITLVLIYKRVAEPLGLVVHGLNAPGHFLAEVEAEEETTRNSMYVDPFFGGSVLNDDEVAERIAQAIGQPVEPGPHLLLRATHRQWLARMLTNLQAAFASVGADRDVIAMQELHALL